MKEEITVKRGNLGFTIATNSVIKDPELSLQAKGLYVYLVSNTVDWKIYKNEVENHSTNGRDATNSAWKELVKNGWITSTPIHEDGKLSGWKHEVRCDLGRERDDRDQTYWKSDLLETCHTENPQLIKTNIKKDQYKKNTVSNDTLSEFELFWKAISTVYKKYRFNTGSKQEALKVFKKMKGLDVVELIKQTDIRLANKRKLLDSKQFAPNPKNVSGWLRYRGWEDNLDLVTNSAANSGAYPPPTFRAAPPTRVIRDL
jgi:hypothetical protein